MGIPDLVNSSAYVAFGKGKWHIQFPTYYPVQTRDGTWNAALADLRGVGRLDIVNQSGDIGVVSGGSKSRQGDQCGR